MSAGKCIAFAHTAEDTNSVVIAESYNAQGLALPHILVLPTRPAPWSGNDFPSLRRGAVQSCIVIVSL